MRKCSKTYLGVRGQPQASRTWRLNRHTGSQPVPCKGCVPPHILVLGHHDPALAGVGLAVPIQKRLPARGNTRSGRPFIPMLESRGFLARPW